MRSKAPLIILAACVVSLSCGVLASDFLIAVVSAEAPLTSIKAMVPIPGLSAPNAVGVPARIKIPRIGVDAAIESVALAADGSMDIPKRPRDAAWYRLGPKPGEAGSAVIAGHLNWLYGAAGAFERLGSVKPGDRIVVKDEHGASTTFVVRELRKYDAKADATDVFASHDGKAHLNLVTCVGAWDKKARQYSDRLVVFADKQEEARIAQAAEPIPMPAAQEHASVSQCASAAEFTTRLAYKSRGAQVRSLQTLLRCLGHFPADIVPNGNFGAATMRAVEEFQLENGLDPVGYLGPATRGALNRYVTE